MRYVPTLAAIALSMLTLPVPARADGDILDRRVDVALAESEPVQAFQGLAMMIGLDAEVAPGLDGRVTVRLQNVRMRTVLDAVCESIGCSWSVESGTPAKLRILPLQERSARKVLGLKEPIDLKVTKADVRQVLLTFGQILSVEVDLDPRITGTVTFELDNVPCGEALDRICEMSLCEWRVDSSGKNPVLRFTARK
jgi:type II secretory pathway component GspD/PulD (secretin)